MKISVSIQTECGGIITVKSASAEVEQPMFFEPGQDLSVAPVSIVTETASQLLAALIKSP